MKAEGAAMPDYRMAIPGRSKYDSSGMIPRPAIPVIEMRGSRLDVFREIGAIRGREIAARVEASTRRIAALMGRGRLRELEKAFLACARREADHFVEEIRAMAEGADVPFGDLFRFNITELSRFVEKCTTVALRVRNSEGPGVLMGHNEDWDPSGNDVLVINVRFTDEAVSLLALSYDGFLPGMSCGLNSHGLLHAVNYLYPRDRRPGLPRIFITRKLVTSRSIREAWDWIRARNRAFGQSINLAKGGSFAQIELTARRAVIRRPRLPAVHTNHYLFAQMRGEGSDASPSSLERLRVVRRILEGCAENPGPGPARRTVRRALSDESAAPYCVWRDGRYREDSIATLATVIVDTLEPRLIVHRRRPDSSRGREIRLID